MAMYCHGQRMQEHSDYLNMCSHCWREVFSWKRAVNDLIRGGLDGEIDFSVSREKFWKNGGKDFGEIWVRAWDRWHKADKRLYGAKKPPQQNLNVKVNKDGTISQDKPDKPFRIVK